MNNFYVYILLDPRKRGPFKYNDIEFKYQPFYVGKGIGRRWNKHFTKTELDKNTPKSNKIKSIQSQNLKVEVIKIRTKLSEEESLQLEQDIILHFGRKDNNGILVNQIDGGIGTAGFKHSEQSKRKISESLMGVNVGRELSQEWKDRIAQNNAKYWSGKSHSEETKRKLSLKNKGRRIPERCNSYILISPEGKTYHVNDGLKYFCEKHGISRSHIASVASGKRKSHKGWKAKKH